MTAPKFHPKASLARAGKIIALVALFLGVHTEIRADAAIEINHLLAVIEDSGCTFIRNGKIYDAGDARAHIQKKYDYLKDRIKTAEQFIKYTATKSSMSGRPYTIRCGSQEEPSAAWLESALARFRAGGE